MVTGNVWVELSVIYVKTLGISKNEETDRVNDGRLNDRIERMTLPNSKVEQKLTKNRRLQVLNGYCGINV